MKDVPEYFWRVGTSSSGKQVLEAPETELERFVNLCDYIGSRKTLEFIKDNAKISMD